MKVGGSVLPLARPIAGAGENAAIKMGIRPEHLATTDRQDASLPARMDFSEYLGSTRYLYCTLDSGEQTIVEQRTGDDLKRGATVRFGCDPRHLRFFASTGERLR